MSDPLFALFLMGCSHDMGVCRAVEEADKTFEARNVCQSELDSELRTTDLFPVIVGKCVEIDSSGSANADQIQWFVDRQGNLAVQTLASDSRARLQESHSAPEIISISTNEG
jgi:hypothetical protein